MDVDSVSGEQSPQFGRARLIRRCARSRGDEEYPRRVRTQRKWGRHRARLVRGCFSVARRPFGRHRARRRPMVPGGARRNGSSLIAVP
jgi:hypothetical protein